MKLKTTLLISALVITTLATPGGTALAGILTFDDLPTPSPLGDSVVPTGYGNLDWSGFNYVNGTAQGPSGYANAVVSPSNVAYNAGGNPAQITGGVFNLNSAYLTGVWNDGLQVEVQGFVGSTLTYDNTYTVNTTGPTLITFNYVGIDQVNFISSGGTPNPSYPGQGSEFAMDNLNVTVPEPSTFALCGLGTFALLGFCRQRLNRRLP